MISVIDDVTVALSDELHGWRFFIFYQHLNIDSHQLLTYFAGQFDLVQRDYHAGEFPT